jgi:hypothetical protein
MKLFAVVVLVVALLVAPAPGHAKGKHEGKEGKQGPHDGKHGPDRPGKDPKTEPPTDKPLPTPRTPGERADPQLWWPDVFPTWGVVRRSRPGQLVFGPWFRPAPECASYARRFPTLYVCVRAVW